MAATIKAPVIFTANDKLSPTLRRMSANVHGFASKASVGIARVEHRFNRLLSPIRRAQAQLGQFGLVAGGFLAFAVFKGITNFEEGLVGVGKTTGLTGIELKSLGSDFIDLSDNMRGVSTQSLIEVGKTAGQLGVKGSENILKFSGTMAKLESATDVAGEQGASSIARLLTITGEGVGIIDQFGAALVGLGNNSAATESEILSVASEVARGTAAYGLQAQEILGLATSLKSLGVRPEAAGTAVSKVFKGIEKATLEGGDSLEAYAKIIGKTSKQVTEDFGKSPQKSFNSFIGGLNRISNEGGSVAQALRNAGLSGETVSKGIVPLATNFEMLNEKMALSSNEFNKNTALNDEFETSTKTVNVAVKDVVKSFTNLTLKTATAGSGLEILRSVLLFVSDNMLTLVITAVSLAGTMLLVKGAIIASKVALFAYNVVMGVNSAITQTNKRALIQNAVAQGAYRTAMLIGTAVTWLANSAFIALAISVIAATWPILAIIAAVLAVVYIFLYWDEIVAFFGKQFTKFTEMLGTAWDSITKFFQEFSFVDFFKGIGNALIKFMLLPLKSMLVLLSQLPGKLGDLASVGLDKLNEMEANINFDRNGDESGVLPNSSQAASQETTETIRDSNVRIDVRDKGGNVEKVYQDGTAIPISMQNTVGVLNYGN
jgi:TP901 family phage tail tape measure protein